MIAEFSRENLKNPSFVMLHDYISTSETLFVCFSGMGPEGMVPPFEFAGVLRNYDVKKLFVRDTFNLIFHNGLENETTDIPQTVDLLKKMIEKSKATRVIFIGNCQGGYAALLFGALVGVDRVISFAPLTFLDRENCQKHNETRWPEAFQRFYTHPSCDPQYFDLLKIEGIDKANIYVYYDVDFAADAVHSERLLQLPGVQLFSYTGGEHLMVRNLKKSGELDRILQNAITMAPTPS